MVSNRTYRTVSPNRSGFTIIECLVALAISALLLTAVAVAFSASVTNYQENESMFWAMNNGRQALTRMTSQLRTGYNVNPAAPSNECSFFTAANEDITYEYRSADQKLYLVKNGDGSEYVLCDNVTAATFEKTPTNDFSDCKSIQIMLTVQCEGAVRTLSAASVIRRNLGL